MKGFEINENVLSMVVCGGCFDLYHLCQVQQFVTPKHVCNASEFSHLPLIVFMIETGADMNAKTEDVEFLYLIGLLFIMLLKMVIFVLLNIYLIKKLI